MRGSEEVLKKFLLISSQILIPTINYKPIRTGFMYSSTTGLASSPGSLSSSSSFLPVREPGDEATTGPDSSVGMSI